MFVKEMKPQLVGQIPFYLRISCCYLISHIRHLLSVISMCVIMKNIRDTSCLWCEIMDGYK